MTSKVEVRYVSDLHLDMDVSKVKKRLGMEHLYGVSPMEGDSDRILVIAGDIWHGRKWFRFGDPGVSWISGVAAQFRQVVVVLGNHDWWGVSLGDAEIEKTREALSALGLANVVVLEASSWKDPVSGWVFVGGTLWTDYGKSLGFSVDEQLDSGRRAQDKYVGRGVTPDANFRWMKGPSHGVVKPGMLKDRHQMVLKAIEDVQAKVPRERVFVVTHYLPWDPEGTVYANRLEMAWDFSRLEGPLGGAGVWVHGHDHAVRDGVVNGCRILANPRGYPGEETGFDDTKVISLDY